MEKLNESLSLENIDIVTEVTEVAGLPSNDTVGETSEWWTITTGAILW